MILPGLAFPKTPLIFAVRNGSNAVRGISSAGSEHLPYKQRVGGSNPSSPTLKDRHLAHKLVVVIVPVPTLGPTSLPQAINGLVFFGRLAQLV